MAGYGTGRLQKFYGRVWQGVAGFWMFVGCDRIWNFIAGCGKLWQSLKSWQRVEYYGRVWKFIAGHGKL